jgi:hypothetical protein
MAYGYVDVQGGNDMPSAGFVKNASIYSICIIFLHGGYQVLVSHSMGHGYRL